MWEGIDDNQPTKHVLTWAVERMKNNMLIWVTDGTYGRDRADYLCGVGWIIFCTATGKRLMGTCWERSNAVTMY